MYTGTLVRLREYRRDDVEKAQEYLNDPEVTTFMSPRVPFLYTLRDEEKWFESVSASNDAYNFALEALDTGEYIGGCGINEIDWKNSRAVIGIFIGNKTYWSRGYGTDAVSLLVRFIFEQMNIHKVRLSVYAFNERAIACYKKCGFQTEGVLRGEVFKNGQYHDEHIMGLLRDEWKA